MSSRGAKRSIAFSPAAFKEMKKTKITSAGGGGTSQETGDASMESEQTSSGDEELNTSDIHETILKRVQETLAAFKQDDATSSSVQQMMPILATALTTAVSVAVTEAVRGIARTMKEAFNEQCAKATANEKRLQAALTKLTYENDRLQQYTRRESVRIHGIKSASGETGEEVEQKAIQVFKTVGVEVKPDDLATVHRAGKEKKGARPILVKFISRRKRQEVMEKKKVLKEKEDHKGVYINDDLTPLRAKLLGFIQRHENIQRAWTVNGRIHCLKKMPVGMSVQQKPFIVETPDDLFKIGFDLTAADLTNLGLSHLVLADDE